jgi:hypothetical protein
MDCTSEISMDFTRFSSSTPSVVVSNSGPHSTTIETHESRSKLAGFGHNHQKIEKSLIFTQNPPISLPPSVLGPANDVTRVHASQTTPNEAVLRPSTLFTGASSPEDSHPLAVTKHPKNERFGADFESQPSTEHLAPTCIVTGLKTRSAPTDFTKNGQKVEKPLIFNPEPPKSSVSERFSWADDADRLPTPSIVPTKCPRDLSDLRSSTVNPFSSLKRRRRHPQNSHHRHFQPCHKHFYHPHCYPSPSHWHAPDRFPQPAFGVSLDWDQDPRLADLSNALRALGWSRH